MWEFCINVGDSTHVLLPRLELVRPSLSSAQCLDSIETEQQKQERAVPVAPGEALAGLET